jgi:uncharacterized protein (TIGR03086 family)
MSEMSDRYEVVADGFSSRLYGIAPDQWTNATPCTEWTVRDLVCHVITTHQGVKASVDGREPQPVQADGDLEMQWVDASGAVLDALDDPSLRSRTVRGMFAEQTFESLVGRLLCADTLVHTWDLARATGQTEQLDETAVHEATKFLAPIDEAIRRPGGFAPKVTPATGADAQTQLLNFCGRAC